ncbi:MAG TPA: DUF502 domain-containing protein [Chlamydiales bacterium]|nr:DUF502 domain-containing protein [Chlamydiales bacterium]
MKKHLLTGLVLLLPIVLTIIVIRFLFDLFTEPFVPIVEGLLRLVAHKLGIQSSPELGLFVSRIFAFVLLIIVIFGLGIIARWFFFRNLLNVTHKILSRIPLIKTVYQVSRDIFAALFSTNGKKAFKRPLLFFFPSQSTHAIGFEAGEVADEIQKKSPVPLISVFAPTAPHPISGFLLLLPKDHVYPIDMTNEEALKYLVSCGLIHPEKKDVGKTI